MGEGPIPGGVRCPRGPPGAQGPRRRPVTRARVRTVPLVSIRAVVRTLPLLALVVAFAGLAYSAAASGPTAPELLPDLDQQTPNQLLVARGGRRWLLGFQSAVRNVGAGPLLIDGHRRSRATRFMAA